MTGPLLGMSVALRPLSNGPFWEEVVFESLQDWHDKMAVLPPDPEKLPLIVGMQDRMPHHMISSNIEQARPYLAFNELLLGP